MWHLFFPLAFASGAGWVGLVGGLAFSGAGFRVFGVLWVEAFISGLAEGAGRCLFDAYGSFNLVLFCCLLGGRWSSRLIFFSCVVTLPPPLI